MEYHRGGSELDIRYMYYLGIIGKAYRCPTGPRAGWHTYAECNL